MSRAKEVLKNNMKGLTELAELLLEKEVIFSEDLERIFGKRKADHLKELREAEAQPRPRAKSVGAVEPEVVKKKKKSAKSTPEKLTTAAERQLLKRLKGSKKDGKKGKDKRIRD